MWNFLNNFLLGFSLKLLTSFCKLIRWCFLAGICQVLCMDLWMTEQSSVFYRGPPCVMPRKASGYCFASESHSHCSSIKHLLQPPPFAAALSFCIHTRAFHFKPSCNPLFGKIFTGCLDSTM